MVFYAFNRFFRNVAEMELTIRKLPDYGDSAFKLRVRILCTVTVILN